MSGKKQKEENKKFIEEVEKGLEEGKIHTKTHEEKVEEHLTFEQRKRNTYLGALLLISASYQQLSDLQDMGATQMRTKNLINQTIKSMEKDLNTIFDIKDENVKKEAAIAKAKGEKYEYNDEVSLLIDADTRKILALVEELVK